MTSDPRRLLVGRLNDAHAMEVGLVPILEDALSIAVRDTVLAAG